MGYLEQWRSIPGTCRTVAEGIDDNNSELVSRVLATGYCYGEVQNRLSSYLLPSSSIYFLESFA